MALGKKNGGVSSVYSANHLQMTKSKQSQNKKDRKFGFSCTKKCLLFLQLAAEKKTPFLVQLKLIFVPSYFDRVLVQKDFVIIS